MKKRILACAALAACAGFAYAQSSVTLYGSFDGGLRNVTNADAAGGSKLTLSSNGNYFANRLGFTGSEDLGGGLRASFVLESGFNTGTGTLDNANSVLFNRSAWVGLGAAWGKVSLGRQYTLAFMTLKDYEPFGYKYTALIPVSGGAGTSLPSVASAAGLGASATSGTRFNNDVQYAGTFGPVTVRAEYALGEQAGSTRNGAAQAVGLNYVGGPAALGAAYTRKKTATGFDNTAYTFGGAYSIGPVRAMLGYAKETQKSAAAGDYRNKTTWGGVIYTVGPALELTGAWYQNKYSNATEGKRDLYLIGATYALSKRTRLYADIDRNKYSGALIPATGQTGQVGVAAGVSHTF